MSRSSYLFAGIFGSFALSCLALVVVPQSQIGRLQPQVDGEEGTDIYPLSNPRKGREVYAAEGCITCHSQQIRDEQNGLDIERGITTHHDAEAQLNRKMVETAREVIAVGDASKFGKVCLHRIIDLGDLDALITDTDAPAYMDEAAERLGVRLFKA